MLDAHAFGLKRTIHVIDSDHAQRASLAMRITGGGGHPEIYEDLDELLEDKPVAGALLLQFPVGGVGAVNSRLAAAGIFLPIIVFAERPEPAQVMRAAHDGAADFLAADFSGDDLMGAYDYSQQFVERNGATLARRQRAEEQVSALSRRERQILVLLLDGHSNKSMGRELNLSPRTVEDYRLNTLRKLGVASTSAAIRIGLEADLRTAGTGASRKAATAPVSVLS